MSQESGYAHRPYSLLPTHYSPCSSKAQASLEMTVALMGTLLLLFGSVKVFLWMVERLVARQQSYEATRVAAGGDEPGKRWNEPTAPLRIFKDSP